MQQTSMISCGFIGLCMLSGLSGCTSGGVTELVKDGTFSLPRHSVPAISVPVGTFFYENVSYGSGDRNVFDIYLPESDTKTPLIVFFHGGGFIRGDKSNHHRYERQIQVMLNAGVAFAAINYPFLDPMDDIGLHKPLKNSSYCLQFLRHHHDRFNIDKDRVAAFGSSAGAGTALWLGTHDDMKNDASLDPIERESTRLCATAVLEGQATYDFLRLGSIFGSSGSILEASGFDKETVLSIESSGFDKETINEEAQNMLMFYGIDSVAQLFDPAIVAYRADVDMLGLMDKDDAPVWIQCIGCKGTAHHENHSKAVMDQANLVGLEHVANIPKLGVYAANGSNWVDFLLQHLN